MDCIKVGLQRLLPHLIELILALLLLTEAMLADVLYKESAISQSAFMLNPRVVVLYSANKVCDASLATHLGTAEIGATVV